MDEIGEDFVDKNWSGQHAMNINKYLYIFSAFAYIIYIYIFICTMIYIICLYNCLFRYLIICIYIYLYTLYMLWDFGGLTIHAG